MYDPLVEKSIQSQQAYPCSYWSEQSGEAPADDGSLTADIEVDVAIIGAGYTGLSCAYHLAKDFGIKSHVFDANRTAWGCSGRNAGFILKSTGRKAYAPLISQWGNTKANLYYQEVCEGVETVNEVTAQGQQRGINCQAQEKGYLRVAHKTAMVKSLLAQQKLLAEKFDYSTEFISQSELSQLYFDSLDAFGALRFSDGYGINPLKLAWTYQTLARSIGVKIYTDTPVSFQPTAQKVNSDRKSSTAIFLQAPQATIKAQRVVNATNGYMPQNFHSRFDQRNLPVLSQIIVTSPMSDQQIADSNFLTQQVVMDTRALKYYFRKLPDNRILFGGRGAINGKSADDPYYANRLLSVLHKSFPALHSLTIDYAWAGWINISLDDIPHIYQDESSRIFYAGGYCGNGVSFTAQAGKRLAQKIAGKALPDIPLYNQPLPKFPFAQFRRVGQWGYFHYGKLKDRWF